MTPPDPYEVASLVTSALDAIGVISTIGGSIAAAFAGEPRTTLDIDIVAALDESHVAPFVARVSNAFCVDEDAVVRAVRTHGTVNLIHEATQFKVDLFIAGGTPLDAQQLARRRRVEVGGHVLYVHPPEDILLQKLRWFRRGGEVSDRQWRDLRGIVRTQGKRLDVAYLSANAKVLDVADLLERLLAEG